jgi:hypothetical protein
MAAEYRILRKKGKYQSLKQDIPAFWNRMPCGLVCRYVIIYHKTGMFVRAF